ncbi:MAG: TonB-dependent receptor, partial [Sphingobacteriia bacterium]
MGLVPNLQYGDLGVGYQQQIALRGISVFSDDPAVATYVDGVVSMDIAANGFLLMDVARIEVLRGPQGTLYGRNAMGGVINIITKLPADTLQVYAESGLGNQGLQRWNAALRLPIVKHKLMLSVAGGYQTQHGFNRNDLSDKLTFRLDSLKGSPEDGQRVGDAEAFYLNVALRWVPGKRWLATLQVKTQTDRSLGASSYFQAAENDSIAFARPYTFAVNDLGRHQRQVYNTSLLLRWFHPKFTFSSISAHQYVLQAYEGIDQDLFHWDYASGASFDGSRLGRPYPQGVLSQEWKLSAPADASRLQWTAGLYLFQQRYNRQQATVYKRLAYLFGGAPGTEVVQTNRLNWGAAAFGQVSYALWAHMKLTAGLRYDYESRRATTGTFRLQTDGSRDYSRPDTTRQLAFGALSPKLALSYQSGQHHTYVSYTRGYRVGGLNMNSPLPDFQAFTPEYSDNYELGYRVANRRNTWQVSATLFHLYWRSMQLEVQPTPGVWVTDNIGNARSQGAELELLARPWPGATIEATGGFNQAYYQ